jgi:hypothetical protein
MVTWPFLLGGRESRGGRVARITKLTVIGGKKPRQQKANKRDWSKAKAEAFLAALADTCNVSEACRQSGVSVASAYRHRNTDAGFRAGWVEAIASAYRQLELVLLNRAFNGTEKVVTRRDGSEERMMEYSERLALTLLKMHRDTAVEAEAEVSPAEANEVRERIIAKLKRLRKRFEADDAEAAEAESSGSE